MTSRWIVMALRINIELNLRHLVPRINKWPVANWWCFILLRRHKRLAFAQQISPLHSPPTRFFACWKTDPHLILFDWDITDFCFLPSLCLSRRISPSLNKPLNTRMSSSPTTGQSSGERCWKQVLNVHLNALFKQRAQLLMTHLNEFALSPIFYPVAWQ